MQETSNKKNCYYDFFFFRYSLNFSHLRPFNLACHSGSFECWHALIREWVTRWFPQLSESQDIHSQNLFSLKFLLLSQTQGRAAGPFPGACGPSFCVYEIYFILFYFIYFKDISFCKPASFSHILGCTRRRPIKDTFTRGKVFSLHLLTDSLESVGMQKIFWLKAEAFSQFITSLRQFVYNYQVYVVKSTGDSDQGLLNIRQRSLN